VQNVWSSNLSMYNSLLTTSNYVLKSKYRIAVIALAPNYPSARAVALAVSEVQVKYGPLSLHFEIPFSFHHPIRPPRYNASPAPNPPAPAPPPRPLAARSAQQGSARHGSSCSRSAARSRSRGAPGLREAGVGRVL
jgi:hypothetical protein